MKKRLVGIIVSDKMQKTVVVRIDGIKVHPLYRKRFRVFKKYKADTGNQSYKIGDRVVIEQTRPLSKEKRWRVIKKLAEQTVANEITSEMPDVLVANNTAQNSHHDKESNNN